MAWWSEMPLSTTSPPPSMCPAPYSLYYYISPPCKCKQCRWVLLPAQLWCQYQSTKHDNHDGGGKSSSPSAKPGAILTRVKEWLSAGVAVCQGHCQALRIDEYAVTCYWSHSSGWLNWVEWCWSTRESWWLSTAIEMRTMLQQSNGWPLCGKSGQGHSFNAGGWSTLIFLSIGMGVWCGVEGRRSCCCLLSSKCQLLFSPVLHDIESQLWCHNGIHHSDQFPSYGWSYGSFLLMENPMPRAPALALPSPVQKKDDHVC